MMMAESGGDYEVIGGEDDDGEEDGDDGDSVEPDADAFVVFAAALLGEFGSKEGAEAL
jgi:hypothetical protein